MASTTLADDIRQKLGTLSPAERKVARVILAGYPAAGFETVAVLAERAAVSAPTVIRFVNRLGYQGFPDFQAACAKNSKHATPPRSPSTSRPTSARAERSEDKDAGTGEERTRRSCGTAADSSLTP